MAASSSQLKHIFVLMLENRSFDHLLGFSKIANNKTHINGLTGKETNTYVYNGVQHTYQVKTPVQDPMTTDPGHEFLDTLEQLCGQGVKNPFPKGPYPPITNAGFVANYATSKREGTCLPQPSHYGDVMASCNPSTQSQMLTYLAKEFAVCDNWFASMPGPTWPNRFFAMGASSSGLDDSPRESFMFDWETLDGFEYPNGSIFDLLKKHNLPFRLYNDRDAQFSHGPHWLNGGWIPIVASLKHLSIFNVHSFRDFANDIHTGTYPYPFTFIEPNYGDIFSDTYKQGSSQHPMDLLSPGDMMISATYAALRASNLWESSLLIITYDEHGGFYDHVAPPQAPKPEDHPRHDYTQHGFDFTQYGVRVPAVLVSPLIPRNTIDHTLYDHTSILKTVEALCGLPSLTKRDAKAHSLLPQLSLEEARQDCPATLPPPAEPVGTTAERPQPLSAAEQERLDQEPLPAQGNVIGFLHIAAKADIDMLGGGDAAKQGVQAKLKALRTQGDAKAYLRDVAERVTAARATRPN